MTFGHAQTWVSKAVTDKFWVVDRAMFALSPYLTWDEAEKIGMELENMARSKHEGNFSSDDAFNFIAQMIGGERYQAVTMMWIMDQQNAITSLYSPEQLRPAWVHKITMTEGTPDEIARNPDNYIEIQTTKDEFK